MNFLDIELESIDENGDKKRIKLRDFKGSSFKYRKKKTGIKSC